MLVHSQKPDAKEKAMTVPAWTRDGRRMRGVVLLAVLAGSFILFLTLAQRAEAFVYWTNQKVLDGIVNGAAALARGLARVVMWIDRTIIDGAVNGLGQITGETGGLLKYFQSGNVQWYAVALFAGVLVLTAFFVRLP